MHSFCELSGGPAALQGSPGLAGVKAPRLARPLRAAALTPAPPRTSEALTAGPLTRLRAIPLAIERDHVGALVPSNDTAPSARSATVQIILVPLPNAARYLPPRLLESVVSSSSVSDSRVPPEPNVRRPNSRRN